MSDYTHFYKGKKVFVTGHTGFKGTWLMHMLNQFGSITEGYALEPEVGGFFELTECENICQHFEGDIRDEQLLKKRILAFEPDLIFHLAAQPLVIDSYDNPVYTFEVNLMGTVYLLNAVRDLKKRCTIIVITTDKVYEDQRLTKPYKEEDKLGGFDPYSTSKTTVEFAVNSYRNSFFNIANFDNHGKSLVTARAGNVIGGGDFSSNRIIPDIVKSLLLDKEVKLRNPNSIRPWQHVLDALFGYTTLAKIIYDNPKDKVLNSAWNFGPYHEDIFTVEDLTKKAIGYWGTGTYSTETNSNSPKETDLLKLDASKAHELLDWAPKWLADMAIEHTIEWYKSVVKEKQDASEVTNIQVSHFLKS